MTVKEMMQKLIDEDANDIDFCDDYDESAWCAYCLNHWSPEAEEMFKTAFNLPVDMESSRLEGNDRVVIVHCENDEEVYSLYTLLYAMAGYVSEEEYDRLFPEPEEEPEPKRAMFEVVLAWNEVRKAYRVDFTTSSHGCPVAEILFDNNEWEAIPVSQIVRIIGEVK